MPRLSDAIFGTPRVPLPPSPLATIPESSACESAAALLRGWLEQIPDAIIVDPPVDTKVEAPIDGLRQTALTSSRLAQEQVLVEWLDRPSATGADIWIHYPGFALEAGGIE